MQALGLCILQLYADKVSLCRRQWDRMLAAPAPSASAEAQQQHLKLLVEVYKRTQASCRAAAGAYTHSELP